MFEWINLFPPYLTVFTLVFVICPTVITLSIRITLYNYLQDSVSKVKRLLIGESRGKQPRIVEKLETRFKQTSYQLESVNTSALIEGFYSEEKFSFFSRSLRCESWDYFSKSLPNLLLAFGLLGTFLGITLNLTNISGILDQSNLNNSNLIQNLQIPLESMGIAFITSLIALLCSSVLIIVNLLFNTNLAKIRLISSLEDYLDNIFHPTIEGQTRLDKAVNRMVDQQNEFLTRFHDNVTKAVESSLGRVAQQIADGNKEATGLAKQVYERLIETSGTLARGADVFEKSTLRLDEQVKTLNNIVQHENFVEYSKSLQSSVTNFREILEKIIENKVADKLILATDNLQTCQNQFTDAVKSLKTLIKSEQIAISTFEQSVNKITDLGEKITELNQQSSQLLEENKTSSHLLIHKFESSINSLDGAKADLNQMTNTLSHNTEQLNLLGDRLTKIILQQSERSNYQGQIITEKTEQATGYLREIESILTAMRITNLDDKILELNQITNYINDNSGQLNLLGDKLTKIIIQ